MLAYSRSDCIVRSSPPPPRGTVRELTCQQALSTSDYLLQYVNTILLLTVAVLLVYFYQQSTTYVLLMILLYYDYPVVRNIVETVYG